MTDLITQLYIYCTDFTIALANLLGISYYDVNALIFCIFLPLLTLFLTLTLMLQLKRKRTAKKI
jgi:hypothetical protein